MPTVKKSLTANYVTITLTKSDFNGKDRLDSKPVSNISRPGSLRGTNRVFFHFH